MSLFIDTSESYQLVADEPASIHGSSTSRQRSQAMPRSNAEREKLISGVSLLLLAALFVAAFVLLRPSEEDFQLSALSDPVQSTQALDELELAYLRARVATGKHAPGEVSLAVGKMVRAQQFEDARVLLSGHPDVPVTETDRFRIELELAGDTTQLSSVLHYLVKHPSLQSGETLLRATRLSHKLDEPSLSAQLYAALGQNDNGNSVHWYEQCEVFASTNKDRGLALSCLRSAIENTTNAEKRFALELRLLENLVQADDKTAGKPGYKLERDLLVNELLAVPDLETSQLEALAATLLAIQRPQSAIGVYEELASTDPQRRVHWLDEAARWSVETSQPIRAVALLDRTRTELSDKQQAELDQRVETLMIAAGEQNTALRRAQAQLKLVPNDVKELQSATLLAQQSGKLGQALQWNTRLLLLQPGDSGAVNRQVTLLLAARELEQAYSWARKAVVLQPDNIDLREQLARICEWTSRPYEAIKHRQIIDQSVAESEIVSDQ